MKKQTEKDKNLYTNTRIAWSEFLHFPDTEIK